MQSVIVQSCCAEENCFGPKEEAKKKKQKKQIICRFNRGDNRCYNRLVAKSVCVFVSSAHAGGESRVFEIVRARERRSLYQYLILNRLTVTVLVVCWL